MNLPPVVYSLKFWEAIALIIAVVLVAGDVANPETVALVLGAILAVLRLIGINPSVLGLRD